MACAGVLAPAKNRCHSQEGSSDQICTANNKSYAKSGTAQAFAMAKEWRILCTNQPNSRGDTIYIGGSR